jgi:hypothetical protein
MANLPSRRAFVSGAATGLFALPGGASAASIGSTSQESLPADFLQAAAGAVSRPVQSKLRDIISVRDFGAKGDGTTDDTAAFQAALDVGASYGNSYTSLYIPPGKYRITNTIRINKNHVHLYGAGNKSQLYFDPPVAGRTMILVQNSDASQIAIYITLEDFAFNANPALTSYAKTGIKIVDGSIVSLSRINIIDYSWTSGGSSIGIHTCGRDTHTIFKCTMVADKPIYIDKNPNSDTYQADFYHFIDLWPQPQIAGGYGITFAPGVNPSNFLMEGGGSYSGDGGIYLNNTSVTTKTPSCIRIVDFRAEGGSENGTGVGGAYGVYLNFGEPSGDNPSCSSLELVNCSVNGANCKGFWIKNVSALVARNISCGARAGLDAFVLTDVKNATITNLGVVDNASTVAFNNMHAQVVHKSAYDPAGKSIAFGIFAHHDADTPGHNLVYRNGVRSWQRTEALHNRGEMILPALAAEGSMLVFVSSGLGGAVYAVTHASSFLLNATPGWEAAIGIVSDGAGNSRLVNRSAGTQIFTVNTNGT